MGKKGSTWLNAVKKAFSASKESSLAVDTEQPEQHKDANSKFLYGKTATHERRSSFKEKNYRWSFSRSSRALHVAAADQQLHHLPPDLRIWQEHLPDNSGHCSIEAENTTSLSMSGIPSFQASSGQSGQHQNKQAMAVAMATAAAAEAAVAAAQAAAQVAKLTSHGPGAGRSGRATPRSSNFGWRSQEELAAIRIQAAFRGYLARRALRTLKGMARLQMLAKGRLGQRQTTATMRCMQALVRAQAAVRGRRTTRLCHDEAAPEGLARCAVRLEPQLQMHPPDWVERHRDVIGVARQDKGDESGRIMVNQDLPEWDDSTQTIEETQARERSKQEAAVKRERAMAYAFSHQLNAGTSYYSNTKSQSGPQLGWNWLERWMAARPWENRRPSPAPYKDVPGARITPGIQPAVGTPRQPSPRHRGSAPTTPVAPPAAWKPSMTPRTASPIWRPAAVTPIASSNFSGPATRLSAAAPASSRVHSMASSSLRDDLSVASFSGTPSYMATTESARAKLRSHSTPKQRPSPGAPGRIYKTCAPTSVHSEDTRQQPVPLRGSVGREGAARQRLSFARNAATDSAPTHSLFSWRSSAPLQRNFSFEGYTKTKF